MHLPHPFYESNLRNLNLNQAKITLEFNSNYHNSKRVAYNAVGVDTNHKEAFEKASEPLKPP